jgi:hypothetical protein
MPKHCCSSDPRSVLYKRSLAIPLLLSRPQKTISVMSTAFSLPFPLCCPSSILTGRLPGYLARFNHHPPPPGMLRVTTSGTMLDWINSDTPVTASWDYRCQYRPICSRQHHSDPTDGLLYRQRRPHDHVHAYFSMVERSPSDTNCAVTHHGLLLSRSLPSSAWLPTGSLQATSHAGHAVWPRHMASLLIISSRVVTVIRSKLKWRSTTPERDSPCLLTRTPPLLLALSIFLVLSIYLPLHLALPIL